MTNKAQAQRAQEHVRSQRGPADPSRGAYERADLSPRAAGWTIAGLVGVVLVVAAGVGLLFHILGDVRQPPAPQPRLVAPAPALQVSERPDRAAIEARARARLEGRNGGLPIGRAMQQTLTAGWDAPR